MPKNYLERFEEDIKGISQIEELSTKTWRKKIKLRRLLKNKLNLYKMEGHIE